MEESLEKKTFEFRSISRAADMKAVKSDQFNLKLRYLHMHRAHSIHFEFSDTLVTAIPLKVAPPASMFDCTYGLTIRRRPAIALLTLGIIHGCNNLFALWRLAGLQIVLTTVVIKYFLNASKTHQNHISRLSHLSNNSCLHHKKLIKVVFKIVLFLSCYIFVTVPLQHVLNP